MYSFRLQAVVLVLILVVLVLLGGLFRIQVLQGSKYRREADEQLKLLPGFRPTTRGGIYDRNGVALAQDNGAWDLAVYFPFIEMDEAFVSRTARRWGISNAELRLRVLEMWPEVSRLTGLPETEIRRRIETIRRRVEEIRRIVAERHGRRILVREENYDPRRPPDDQPDSVVAHGLAFDIDPGTYAEIASRPDDFPGLVVLESSKREYPYGGVAPHVIGRLGEVTREELNADDPEGNINARFPRGSLKRYWPGDEIGRTGIEASCEDLLRGERGAYQKGIDGSTLEDIRPVSGRDVRLTLDIALQADVEALLDRPPALPPEERISGAAVVLDCRTGEVLVLASAPRHDINYYSADFPDLVRDPAGPLVHRAVTGRYPLGSVFKAVTATAALQEGVLTPHAVLSCDGHLDPERYPDHFRCHVFISHGYGHGPMVLYEAIKKSCNVYFWKVAERLCVDREKGRRRYSIGVERLTAWAHRLGLGQPTGINLPGEAAGSLNVRDPRNLAVGQGELLVTPIQAAQLYGLVATDGRMPPLRLVRDGPAAPGRSREDLRDHPLDPEHMAAIREGFAAVVNEPGGTGYRGVRLPDLRVAGKTGTAQAGGEREDHAWFVGYAPAEEPRIAFAVIVEHGGHGGETAGPIAREIVRACRAHGYVGKKPEPPVGTPAERPTPPAIPALPSQDRPRESPAEEIVPLG